MEKYFMNSETYKFLYLADNQFNIIFMKHPKISTETTFFYKTSLICYWARNKLNTLI